MDYINDDFKETQIFKDSGLRIIMRYMAAFPANTSHVNNVSTLEKGTNYVQS